jgi:D-galactarolactone cycloisomerase
MKIIDIKSSLYEVEASGAEEYRYTRIGITQVFTDEGITGYGFRKVDQKLLHEIKSVILGKDPRNVIELLASGALKGCATIENALWDICGKAAGVPVRNLLGSAAESIDYYLTCVWPGKTDQSHLTMDQQAEQIALYYSMGHRKFKFRGWRPSPLDDVRIVEKVRNLVGGREKIELMIDRTAHLPGWVWSYEEARDVAIGLQNADATWLEEPFAREDLDSYRRLTTEVEIPITGGEFSTELSIFRDYISTGAVDIIQPDVAISGGIWPTRLVSAVAEAYNMDCILHGTNGPDLAASLQVAATIPSCRMMEIALIFPPLTPEEMYAPLQRILKSDGLYTLKDGKLILPTAPGLGVEIDEAALAGCAIVG